MVEQVKIYEYIDLCYTNSTIPDTEDLNSSSKHEIQYYILMVFLCIECPLEMVMQLTYSRIHR